MFMENATTFGRKAAEYRAARPGYPEALYRWIAGAVGARDLVWDVGTGSGQAALRLAADFAQVLATDIDAEQIAQAPQREGVRYRVAPAHRSGLEDGCVDAFTAATALHWFDHARFWPEVRRVARAGAVFCSWTYHRVETDEDVRAALIDPLEGILDPYWSQANRRSWRGHDPGQMGMPFEVIAAPDFACELSWTPREIAGFVRSWSAHRRAVLDGHGAGLAQIEAEGLAALGDARRRLVLPLHVLAARVE